VASETPSFRRGLFGARPDVSASEGQPFSRRCFLGAKGDRETTRLIAKSGLKDTRRIDSPAIFESASRLFLASPRVEDERETRDAPLPLRRRTDETNDGRDVPGTSRFKRVEIVEMDDERTVI
jgi:hypothetical protein